MFNLQKEGESGIYLGQTKKFMIPWNHITLLLLLDQVHNTIPAHPH